MSENTLLWFARMIALVGLGLLIFSSVGGVVMSSKFTAKVGRRFAWLKGNRIFTYHRRISLIGASLFLLHPIPLLFSPKTTGGLNLTNVLLPFTASRQTLYTGFGTLAFYVLLVVVVSSLLIKRMKFKDWRILHYGTYLFLILGFAHSLLISAEYKPGELFDFEEPEKQILLLMATIVVLFVIWRIIAARRHHANKLSRAT